MSLALGGLLRPPGSAFLDQSLCFQDQKEELWPALWSWWEEKSTLLWTVLYVTPGCFSTPLQRVCLGYTEKFLGKQPDKPSKPRTRPQPAAISQTLDL
jgi:hypothetical protein